MPDKFANQSYQQTNCLLVTKKMSTKGFIIYGYRADFLINYNVNGVQYNRWVSGNGLDTGYTTNKASQEALLSQYDFGSTYTCWYNPDDPQYAILVMRQNWYSAFPILVPGFIGVITIFYLLINFIMLLSGSHPEAEVKKTPKK